MLNPKTFDQWMNRLSVLPAQGGGVDANVMKRIYYEALSDLTDEAYSRAALALLKSSRWLPTPAEIRERAEHWRRLAPEQAGVLTADELARARKECADLAESLKGVPLREAFARIDAHYKS